MQAKDVKLISIIIPCHNAANTLEICLQAIRSSDYKYYETIVVDDCSSDDTQAIALSLPCRLVKLTQHQGAGAARNAGAAASQGEIIFFTDADCVLTKNALSLIAERMAGAPENLILGGTYTKAPYDNNFFSQFQSLFIHYCETKHAHNPDYIATHAMAMHKRFFLQHEGFNNQAFPILEDVEYSHRLKRQGAKLVIDSQIQAQHIFNFSLTRSLRNAVRKTRYWTTYTLQRKDLLTDSGTASHELKFNTMSYTLMLLMLIGIICTQEMLLLLPMIILTITNLGINSRFINYIYQARSAGFTVAAASYYLLVYPLAVAFGSILGVSSFMRLCLSPRKLN